MIDLKAALQGAGATQYGMHTPESGLVYIDPPRFQALKSFSEVMASVIWDEIDGTSGIVIGPRGNTERRALTCAWLFVLEHPAELLPLLPAHWRDPQPTRLPDGRTWPGGLPPNLGVGVEVGAVADVHRLDEILQLGGPSGGLPRLRFVVRTGEPDETVADFCALAFEAWRCSICGERGVAPRPDRCRRWKILCNETTIVSQIEWVVDPVGDVKGFAKAARIVVAPTLRIQ